MSNQTPINADVKTQSALCERCRWARVLGKVRCDWCGRDLPQLIPGTFILQGEREITVDPVHGVLDSAGMENTLRNYLHRVSDYINDCCMPPRNIFEACSRIPMALWTALWNRQMYND